MEWVHITNTQLGHTPGNAVLVLTSKNKNFPSSESKNSRYPDKESEDKHWCNHQVSSEQVWTLFFVTWPVQVTHLSLGADGVAPCAWSWPCPAPFLDWHRVVRSQPLSVRQALLLQTPAPRLILMPRFLNSPYAQLCLHLSARANTHSHQL